MKSELLLTPWPERQSSYIPLRDCYAYVINTLDGVVPVAYTGYDGRQKEQPITRIFAYRNHSLGSLTLNNGVLYFINHDEGGNACPVNGPQEMFSVAMSQPYESKKVPLNEIVIPAHVVAILKKSHEKFKNARVYYHAAEDKLRDREKKEQLAKAVEKYLQILWLMVTHMDYDKLEVTRASAHDYTRITLLSHFPTEDKIIYTVKHWYDELVDSGVFAGKLVRPSLPTPSFIHWIGDVKGDSNFPGFEFFGKLVDKLEEYQTARADKQTTNILDISLLKQMKKRNQGVYIDADFRLVNREHTFVYTQKNGVLLDKPKRKIGMRPLFTEFETTVYI